jgi:Sulfotransferase family
MTEGNGHGPGPNQEPVFILAPPRSYSTVTVAFLAGHPQIYGFPELLIFSAETLADILAGKRRFSAARGKTPPRSARDRAVRLTGPLRAIAELHEHSQQHDAIERAKEWFLDRAEWPTERLFDYLIGLVRPSVALEKSPDTVMTDENLRHCLETYPRARYIHLTRHPVAAQRSIQENLGYLIPESSVKWRIASAASMWYLGHLRVARALSELPSDRWFRLRAEDLLCSPSAWARRILNWLGLACDDDIISQMMRTEQWQFAGTGKSGTLFGGDHKFMLAPQLRAIPELAVVKFDPAWGLLDEMCARMTALAGYLGYE